MHFKKIVKKVSRRVLSWQNRFLSYGGRYMLINHVLQSMLIHMLSAMSTPKGIIKLLHQIFTKFFWGNSNSKKKKHWAA